MANTAGVATRFKRDLLKGLHAFGSSVVRGATTADSYKMALFLVTASRGPSDVSYSATGEVSGTGYSAGGAAVTNATEPDTSGTTAFWTPSASISWTTFTSSGAFDTAQLYNDTSASDLVVANFALGSQSITAGTFTLTMPTNDASTGLIRIA